MRLNVELAKKILGRVSDEKMFFSDGGVFSNLVELRDGLKDMSDEVFSHHVREGWNDFSNWIRDCLGDVRLADSLIGLDRKKAARKIGERVAYLEKFLKGKK